jgi:rSAM/selenodomain-associated transferase 2
VSISIIIPALNEAQHLHALLPALTGLAGVVEVIVADGGSCDGTPAAVRASGARLVCAERGRARQMNAGAAGARGDILLFLHADSRLPVDATALIESVVTAHRPWGRFDLRLSGRHWLLRIVERMINWRSALSGIATGDQAIFVRRDLFERVGGYAELPLMEDVELSRRLRVLARPCRIRQPLLTSSRRWEHHGMVRTIVLMWWLRLAYFFGASPETLARRYRRSDSTAQGS